MDQTQVDIRKTQARKYTKILICPMCGGAALVYHGPQHVPAGVPGARTIRHFDGKPAAPYGAAPRCQSCNRPIMDWDCPRWVTSRDLGYTGRDIEDPMRRKFKQLLRAAGRVMPLLADVRRDDSVPDYLRERARSILCAVGRMEAWQAESELAVAERGGADDVSRK